MSDGHPTSCESVQVKGARIIIIIILVMWTYQQHIHGTEERIHHGLRLHVALERMLVQLQAAQQEQEVRHDRIAHLDPKRLLSQPSALIPAALVAEHEEGDGDGVQHVRDGQLVDAQHLRLRPRADPLKLCSTHKRRAFNTQ
jgi:hypothetical protein